VERELPIPLSPRMALGPLGGRRIASSAPSGAACGLIVLHEFRSFRLWRIRFTRGYSPAPHPGRPISHRVCGGPELHENHLECVYLPVPHPLRQPPGRPRPFPRRPDRRQGPGRHQDEKGAGHFRFLSNCPSAFHQSCHCFLSAPRRRPVISHNDWLMSLRNISGV